MLLLACSSVYLDERVALAVHTLTAEKLEWQRPEALAHVAGALAPFARAAPCAPWVLAAVLLVLQAPLLKCVGMNMCVCIYIHTYSFLHI